MGRSVDVSKGDDASPESRSMLAAQELFKQGTGTHTELPRRHQLTLSRYCSAAVTEIIGFMSRECKCSRTREVMHTYRHRLLSEACVGNGRRR